MSISSEITSMGENLKKDYQSIANLGADLTNVDKNIENIAELLDGVYDALPKTEYVEGTEINLGKTSKGKLDYDNGVVGIGQTEQAILPSEYQQVEYIESSGSQYINTQYYANQKTKIIADYYIQPNAEGFIFGARVDSGDANQFCLYYKQDENRYAYRFNGLSVINIYGTVGVKTHAELSTNKYLINNGTIIQDDIQYTGTFLGTLPLYILAQNQGGTATLVSNIKLYSFKILEDNELIRNMIPCYRISDNVIGMYDTVNNVFYTNAGTGVFGKGANAPTPSQEIPIKSVTGNQDVVVSGKNLFDGTLYNGQVGQQGGWSENSQRVSNISADGQIGNFLLEAGTYTLSVEGLQNCTLLTKNASGTILDNFATVWQTLPFTFTLTQEGYVSFTARKSDNSNISPNDYNPQLEQGSTATTYEPYITPTSYQLSLGDIELNAIGNYKDELIYDVDEDKVYKNEKIGHKTFTGASDENWIFAQVSGGTLNAFSYEVSDIQIGETLLANYFKGVSDYSYRTDNTTYSKYVNNKYYIDIIMNNVSSASGFKTWLSTHNTKVMFVLATPTLTEITDTNLRNQVKALYNAHSNNGTTIITSNGNLPMIIKCRALKGE